MDDAVRKMEEDIAARREKLEAGLLESSIVVPVNQALPVRQKVLTGEQVRKLIGGEPARGTHRVRVPLQPAEL